MAPEQPRSALLVEDDEATRNRLCVLLAQQPGFVVTGAAATLTEGQALLARAQPRFLLVDLHLPDGNGIDLIRECSARYPDTLILVITVFGDEAHVVDAIQAGATGYLLKDAGPKEIEAALQSMLAGGSPISPAVARYLLKRLKLPASAMSLVASAANAAPHLRGELPPTLTARETSVLQHIARGDTYTEIAHALGVSANTVGTFVQHVYRKLAVGSRGEAVYEAMKRGLVEPPERGGRG